MRSTSPCLRLSCVPGGGRQHTGVLLLLLIRQGGSPWLLRLVRLSMGLRLCLRLRLRVKRVVPCLLLVPWRERSGLAALLRPPLLLPRVPCGPCTHLLLKRRALALPLHVPWHLCLPLPKDQRVSLPLPLPLSVGESVGLSQVLPALHGHTPGSHACPSARTPHLLPLGSKACPPRAHLARMQGAHADGACGAPGGCLRRPQRQREGGASCSLVWEQHHSAGCAPGVTQQGPPPCLLVCGVSPRGTAKSRRWGWLRVLGLPGVLRLEAGLH